MVDIKKLDKAIEKVKLGENSAFNYIYDATHRLAFYIVYPIVKDYGIAEDVMQNVYINIYEKINLYQSNTSPIAWISTIARNLALNEYNRQKKINISTIDIETIGDKVLSENRAETPLIDLAKENLNEDEFLIVMLCVCEGYKRREVAEILNLSTSGVTWKLNEALKKLKSLTKGGA